MFDDEVEVIDKPKMGRRNIGSLQDNKPKSDAERELAKKVLKFNLDIMSIGRDKPKSVEELQDRFTSYFEQCIDKGMPPTIEGLALCSGWCRSTFYDIGEGKQSPQFADTIKKAKDYVCNYDASMASIGKVNAPIYIFRAKNFYDMKDVQEVKAGPIQDPTRPKNEQEILEALPEVPNETNVIDVSDFQEDSSASNREN